MTNEEFYQRLGEIWNDLNTFWQKLTIPTHSQKSITDLAENLLRIKINRFLNDWLVVAYVPDSNNIESPRLRSPSDDNEKQIYDYLNEALHILVHWWEYKKELDQWSNTARKLKPICDALRKICSESNRKPIQTTGVVAGLRKIAELLKDAGPGRYTVRQAEALQWDLSEVWADISLDIINCGMGHSISWSKKHLPHKEGDLKALVEDAMEILDNIANVPSCKADKSANVLICLATEIENLTGEKPEGITQTKTNRYDIQVGGSIDAQYPKGEYAQVSDVKARNKGQMTPVVLKPKTNPIYDQVFICYCHKDRRWFDDLQTHLKPYVRSRSVTAWSDEQISPGAEWFEEIRRALASTKVAVLLVTKNFLASEFILEHELTPLLRKAEKGGDVQIIWIPIRACSYKETVLKDYQAVTDPVKPLANMKKADRDKTWVEICEKIKKAVNH